MSPFIPFDPDKMREMLGKWILFAVSTDGFVPFELMRFWLNFWAGVFKAFLRSLSLLGPAPLSVSLDGCLALPSLAFGTPPLAKSGGRSGIFSWPGIKLGGGIGRRLILKFELKPLSLFVPRSVGCSANGFCGYSGGTRGVRNERAGGEYDGISAGYIGMVA